MILILFFLSPPQRISEIFGEFIENNFVNVEILDPVKNENEIHIVDVLERSPHRMITENVRRSQPAGRQSMNSPTNGLLSEIAASISGKSERENRNAESSVRSARPRISVRKDIKVNTENESAGESTSSNGSPINKKRKRNKNIPCHTCKKPFSSWYDLKRHQKTKIHNDNLKNAHNSRTNSIE